MVRIVIPVYNAANYSDEWLNAVTQQKYTSLGIILANDGSKAESLSMCQEWAQKVAHIRVVDHKNWGASKTRNQAMAICKGQCIAFVDTDDVIADTFIGTLEETIETTQADCAVVYCISGNQCNTALFFKRKGAKVKMILVLQSITEFKYTSNCLRFMKRISR